MAVRETTYSGYHKYKFKRVYLAGKIRPEDWRYRLVTEPSRLSLPTDDCGTGIFHRDALFRDSTLDDPWPVLENALFGTLDYVGPYFISCSHGCFNGKNSHGIGADLEEYDDSNHGASLGFPMQEWVVARCQEAIRQADLVIAWIDDPSCYGTLVELGYAKALGKMIWIAGPRQYEELWFVYHMADELCLMQDDKRLMSAQEVFWVMFSESGVKHYTFESPIEQRFWEAWLEHESYRLKPQYPIGRYFVDFAELGTKTAIELDGFASHSSTNDIAYDRRRQREIEAQGWRVIRFGGKEIHDDIHSCIKEVDKILRQRWLELIHDQYDREKD